MDNVITPITPPNVSTLPTENTIGGELILPPETQIAVKPQQSFLLSVLTESINLSQITSQDISVVIKNPSNNNQAEIPLKLKLETPLKLTNDEPIEMVVKANAVEAGKINIKIVSINNSLPTKYIPETQLPQAETTTPKQGVNTVNPAQIQNNQVGATYQEKPVVIEKTSIKNQISFHPLDVAALVETYAKEASLPSETIKILASSFKNANIQISVEDIKPQPQSIAEDNSLMLENQNHENNRNTLSQVLSDIKKLITAVPPENMSKPNVTDVIQKAVIQIKNQLAKLPQTNFTSDSLIMKENQLIGIKTQLGNIFLETPVKINNEGAFQLTVRDVTLPQSEKFSLPELLPSQKLTEELMGKASLWELLFSTNTPTSRAKLQNILDILSPLKTLDTKGQELSSRIINKIPAPNERMLSNLVNFMKGAVNNNLETWLGKDLTEELKNSGVEGKETLNRLSGFISFNNKEAISWRIIEIPFLDGNNLSKIRVAVKKQEDHDEDKENTSKPKGGTRFVVDTSFSRLGEFQFDGFSVVKEKRFDLIVRTSQEQEEDLCSCIMKIFKTTLNDVGYVGNININVKENFIKIEEDISKETLKDGIYI